ncbi:MAG: KH domain-containing protein [Actinomycetaceae bacterium]|nr:KH domain-containing protein [Arcanobacterium sp.]MDD7687177.1 KH domain-containing protein [Actinomycetaceae bacterium]MDY5273073.1 R3H domain-containing nucleic acid-binding protein [Arcanobacterium sp.]
MSVEELDERDSMSEADLQQKLEEEGDLAADYLEDLLDIAQLDGDIEISVEADRAAVAIVMDDGSDRRLKRLIGRHGETLDALQELTRLAVQCKTNERSRLMLDILGYRDGRRKAIQAIAREAVAQVKETGEDYSLKPMNPFERKVVHDVVAEAGLYSDSSGVGPNRHVVVMLPLDEDDRDLDDSESADDSDYIDEGSAPDFEDSDAEFDSADED